VGLIRCNLKEIKSDPPCEDGNARITTVYFQGRTQGRGKGENFPPLDLLRTQSYYTFKI